MKKLVFKKLWLLSKREEAATWVEFHPKLTVIRGANDVGKSSILKSLYWVLGAEPQVVNTSWLRAGVIGALDLSVDGKSLTVMRVGRTFGVFDADGNLVRRFSSVTKELAPFLGDLFNFKLTLTSRQGVPERAPPAYCFAPFYVDQDTGWGHQWSSFKNLAQYDDWKSAVINFHAGIRPNQYYELRAEKAAHEQKLDVIDANRRLMEKAAERFDERKRDVFGSLNAKDFQAELTRLEAKVTSLRAERSRYARDIEAVASERILLQQQLSAVEASLRDLDADTRFLAKLDEEVLQCPLCGTEHQNAFTNHLSIFQDQDACRELIGTLSARIAKLVTQQSSKRAEIGALDEKLSEVQAILDESHQGVKVGDIIDAEGQRRAFEIVAEEVAKEKAAGDELRSAMAELSSRMKELTDPKRTDSILQYYRLCMATALAALDVTGISGEQALRLDWVNNETGSDRPRATLAYFYSYLKTVKEYGDACLCPIVIDTPKQQDLDKLNAQAAFRFLFGSQPQGSQLILGTVSLDGVKHDGVEVELSEKRRVLRQDRYDVAAEYLVKRYDQMMAVPDDEVGAATIDR